MNSSIFMTYICSVGLQLFIAKLVGAAQDLYPTIGGNVTLPCNHKAEGVKYIAWKYRSISIDDDTVAEWAEGEPPRKAYSPWGERVRITPITGDLTFNNLKLTDDPGVYRCIYSTNRTNPLKWEGTEYKLTLVTAGTGTLLTIICHRLPAVGIT